MKFNSTLKKLAALVMAAALVIPASTALASESGPRAVCSKSRVSVTPCNQTLVATQGTAITPTQRLVVSGSRDNVFVSLKNQTLPAGLRLNKQTGVISGTPTSTQVAKNYFLYVSTGRDESHCSDSGLVAVINITVSGSTPPPAATYSITASAGSNGTITPSGVGTVNSGGSATYIFTPATGYSVSGISVDNVALSGAALTSAITSGYTFTNVLANHQISVTFAAITYTVTASVVGSHGTISHSGINTYNSGSNSDTFTFTPDSGYHVSAVSVDNTDLAGVALTNAISSGYTFNNVLTNHQISVTFAATTYTVTASVVGSHGTISHSGVNTYNSGSNSDTFTFTPDSGYHVSSVSVDNTDLAGTDLTNAIASGYMFTNVTGNHQISVSFAANGYTITFDANSTQSGLTSTSHKQTGSGSVSLDVNDYVATDGAHFYGWNTKSDGTGTMYLEGDSFNLSADTTLYAIWYFNVTIKANSLDIGGASSAYLQVQINQVMTPGAPVDWGTAIAQGASVTYKVMAHSDQIMRVQFTGSPSFYTVTTDPAAAVATLTSVAGIYLVYPSLLGSTFTFSYAISDGTIIVDIYGG